MTKTHPVKNPKPRHAVKIVTKAIQEKTHKIQDLPQGARIATVQALHNKQFTARRIAKLLNMSTRTVLEYTDETLDDKWLQYKNAIDRLFTEKSDILRFKTNDAIENKLQDKENLQLRDLTQLYRVLNEQRNILPQHSILNQVINVHPALERKHPITIDGDEHQR